MIPGSRKLTVAFDGTPDPRSKPCGADYSTEVVESASAVVVIAIVGSSSLSAERSSADAR